jgi:sigma-70-like protein
MGGTGSAPANGAPSQLMPWTDAQLARLTPRQRQVLELVEQKGLGVAEVATRLGVTVATAQEHLVVAGNRIRGGCWTRCGGVRRRALDPTVEACARTLTVKSAVVMLAHPGSSRLREGADRESYVCNRQRAVCRRRQMGTTTATTSVSPPTAASQRPRLTPASAEASPAATEAGPSAQQATITAPPTRPAAKAPSRRALTARARPEAGPRSVRPPAPVRSDRRGRPGRPGSPPRRRDRLRRPAPWGSRGSRAARPPRASLRAQRDLRCRSADRGEGPA